jgi:hypothetical protein
MPTIFGIATHDGAQIVGLWTIAPVPLVDAVEDLQRNLAGPWSVYSPGRGEGASIELPATTGDQLYWAQFSSLDRDLTLGPFPFTLAADRTWDDIMANPSPLPSGGGGGDDGPAAWFELDAKNTAVPSNGKFSCLVIDDGRAIPRPDLVTVDGSDDTLLHIVTAGLYEVSLMVAPRADGGTVSTPGDIAIIAAVSVNGGSEPPAYYPVARTTFGIASDGSNDHRRGTATLTFPQPLEVGDTISITAVLELAGAAGTGVLWASGDSYLALRRLGD